MKYIFNDLLFDNEPTELDSNDIKLITVSKLNGITYFENKDGLMYAAKNYEKKK